MAGFLTDAINNRVLDCLFGGVAFEPPMDLYVGLSTVIARKGGVIAEPRGGGYFRVLIPNDSRSFPPASCGTKRCTAPIAFPRPDADWGVVKAVFVADAPAGGTIYAIADVCWRMVEAGDEPIRVVGDGLIFRHD